MSTGCSEARSIKVKSIFLCVAPNKAITLSPWQSVTQAMFPKDAVYGTCRISGEFRIDLGRGCRDFPGATVAHCQQRATTSGINSSSGQQQHPALTLQAKWLRSATRIITLSNSTFCPQTVFMCFVWIWEQTAIISLYSINCGLYNWEGVFTARYGLDLYI